MGLVLAGWSVGDGECGAPPYALLQLLGDVPLAAGEELSPETTLAGQSRCADLCVWCTCQQGFLFILGCGEVEKFRGQIKLTSMQAACLKSKGSILNLR